MHNKDQFHIFHKSMTEIYYKQTTICGCKSIHLKTISMEELPLIWA